MIKIVKARCVGEFSILLEFSTGESGTFDMSELVARGGSMVAPLRSPEYFKRAFLELGALAWPNGFDLSPAAVHRELAERGLLTSGRAA